MARQHITLSRRCPGGNSNSSRWATRTEVHLRPGERVTGLRLPGSSSRVHQPSGPLGDCSTNTPPLILQSPQPQGLDKSWGSYWENVFLLLRCIIWTLFPPAGAYTLLLWYRPRQRGSCHMSGPHANDTPCWPCTAHLGEGGVQLRDAHKGWGFGGGSAESMTSV